MLEGVDMEALTESLVLRGSSWPMRSTRGNAVQNDSGGSELSVHTL